MKLKELISQLAVCRVKGDPEVDIAGLCTNSTRLQPGELFVCIPGIPGFQQDRHLYIKEAIEAGAAAILVERDVDASVPAVQVADARHALAVLSAYMNGNPSRQLKLIGVTGTNGKTTTCHMIEAILSFAGHRTGLMGNIGTKIGAALSDTDINTQDPITLQANLRRMAEQSTDFCVMEATSQGLHMGRVIGCHFRTAVFTNLTLDHLDYHGSMDNYLAAKGLLFSRLGNAASSDPATRQFAVLNADDAASGTLRGLTAAYAITYGIDRPADVTASNIRLTAKGTTFDLHSFAGDTKIELQMVGRFNVYNALAAIAAALAEQISLETIRQGLAGLHGVPGRMEVVDEGQPFLVLVDYAHTPDGLEQALATLRELDGGRLVTVFGCGGERDRSKRAIMGSIAARHSDFVVVTSDNPRHEAPEQIMDDIRQGLLEAQARTDSYELIADRREAIARAIALTSPGDIVIIAGKGHEAYQLANGRTLYFDDRKEAREALRKRGHRR
jgi:UDP-N-acetylmuramoyl-L-alanyl-D-glutamate--2,6-diaminopimelate ligase